MNARLQLPDHGLGGLRRICKIRVIRDQELQLQSLVFEQTKA